MGIHPSTDNTLVLSHRNRLTIRAVSGIMPTWTPSSRSPDLQRQPIRIPYRFAPLIPYASEKRSSGYSARRPESERCPPTR